ncbi:unnamed protein product [Macrosiphum euphorbiae]|uniref:Uncharacterized protein n=1 Tax=Macrosiphum euphorbiae TaxID=13131 RepID=A0AAV0Y713_9HEMI|nr:unnamed protein product [Macrosiphum euphorbiae]
MTGSEKEAIERELRVLHRAKTIAVLNRDSTLNRMKAIADMASRVREAPELKPILLTAAGDLDSLWDTFLQHNDAVLNELLDLDLASEYSVTLEAEVRTLYFDARAIVEEFANLPTNRVTWFQSLIGLTPFQFPIIPVALHCALGSQKSHCRPSVAS